MFLIIENNSIINFYKAIWFYAHLLIKQLPEPENHRPYHEEIWQHRFQIKNDKKYLDKLINLLTELTTPLLNIKSLVALLNALIYFLFSLVF